MINIKKARAGFTLIELVIVIIITGIIIVIASRFLAVGLTSYRNASNLNGSYRNVQLAMERMSRDFRSVPAVSNISTATASTFTFTNSGGTSISYSLSGSNLMRNSQALASHVSALTFTYYTSAGSTTSTISAIRYIGVSVTFSGGGIQSMTVTTTVFPEAFST